MLSDFKISDVSKGYYTSLVRLLSN